MSKIDTTGWEEFALFDLCDICLSHDDLQPKQLNAGEIRLVSAGASNNGVVMRCDAPDVEIFEAGCVTVDMFGQCFWQDEPFAAVSHGRVNILKFKETIGIDAGKAFAAILNARLSGKYSFENMCNQKRLSSEKILLPAVSVDEPDWDYMEQYMAQVMDDMKSVAEELHQLESTLSLHALDVSGWKKFKVEELFEVKTTKSVDKRGLDFDWDYEYEYVMRTANNNGVCGCVAYQGFEPNQSGVLSVVQIGDKVCQYRDKPWYASQNIFQLLPKNDCSEQSLIFLARVMTVWLKYTFGENAYSSYPTKVTLSNMEILLPVTQDGAPDLDYMAQEMRRYTESVRSVAEAMHELERV